MEGDGKDARSFQIPNLWVFFKKLFSPARLYQFVATASVCLSWMLYGFAITALPCPVFQLIDTQNYLVRDQFSQYSELRVVSSFSFFSHLSFKFICALFLYQHFHTGGFGSPA